MQQRVLVGVVALLALVAGFLSGCVPGAGQATPPAGTYTAVAAGSSHSCAIATDGTLTCWGNQARQGWLQ